jgi:signal transduction histidine kinase
VQGVAERSGIAIDFNISEDFGRLPADMELTIFRVVQECLTNIIRVQISCLTTFPTLKTLGIARL